MTVAIATAEGPQERASASARLLVTIQDQRDRSYRPLGFLDCLPDGYRFSYVRAALQRDGFQGLPGIPVNQGEVSSKSLFPVFADRIMSPRRPDRVEAMAALGLTTDAAPFEVLARSGGRRTGDLLELVQVPEPDADGRVSVVFLVHGVRHQGEEAAEVVDGLRVGDSLTLRHESNNALDEHAVAVHGPPEPVRLGYVPRPLCEPVHEIMRESHSLTVERINPLETGYHLRLLVRLDGVLSGSAFTGSEFD